MLQARVLSSSVPESLARWFPTLFLLNQRIGRPWNRALYPLNQHTSDKAPTMPNRITFFRSRTPPSAPPPSPSATPPSIPTSPSMVTSLRAATSSVSASLLRLLLLLHQIHNLIRHTQVFYLFTISQAVPAVAAFPSLTRRSEREDIHYSLSHKPPATERTYRLPGIAAR